MKEKLASMENIIVKIFQILAIALFAVLSCFGIFMTGQNEFSLDNEAIYETPDSLIGNLFWLCIAFLLFYVISRIVIRYADKLNTQVIAIIFSIIITLLGIYWVNACNMEPQADQLRLCESAEGFNNGDYSTLERGGYAGAFPHQLGIITLLRLLFYFFGAGNYQAFQYLAAIMAGIMVFSGYQIVRHLSDHQKTAEIYYLLLAISCVPMYLYVPYIYGEIISTSLLFLSGWMFLACLKNFSWPKAVMLGLLSGLAVQIRENTLIILIGFLIVLLVKLITGFSKDTVYSAVSLIVGILLLHLITGVIYENKIPEDSEPMPAMLFIAMGVNWDKENPGWFNGYHNKTFKEYGFDAEASEEVAKEEIKEFINTAWNNKRYAVSFYMHKMTAQWEAPMYQGLVIGKVTTEKQNWLAQNVYLGTLRNFIQGFMNIYQLLVYGVILSMLFLKRKEWVNLEYYVLLIGIFGGFLFTLMWEAKTRYVFPYFLLMLPYAAVGLGKVMEQMNKRFSLPS